MSPVLGPPIDIELPPIGPPTFPIEPSFPEDCAPEENYCYGKREDPSVIQFDLQGEEWKEYLFQKPSLGYEADFSGNASISALKPVKEAKFNVVTEEFETVVVAVQSKKVKQSEFSTEGEGSLELNINLEHSPETPSLVMTRTTPSSSATRPPSRAHLLISAKATTPSPLRRRSR